MSRPVMPLGLAALLLATPGAVHAQGVAPPPVELVRLRREADSLAGLWREAAALVRLKDSLAHQVAPGPLDTTVVGGLVILSNRSPLPVRPGAAAAWRVLDSIFGDRALALARFPIRLHAVHPDTTLPPTGPRWGYEIPWDAGEDDVARALLAAAALDELTDAGLRRWLGEPYRPRGTERRDREAAYVDLVTAPYQATHLCFRGDLEACRSALGLDTGPHALIRQYRTPEERRAVAMRGGTWFWSEPRRAMQIRCQAGEDSLCLALLQSTSAAGLPRPLGPEASRVLLAVVRRHGGREAYSRLGADTTAPILARVTAGAGLPADSLLAEWRQDVLAARPRPVTLSLAGGLAGLAWTIVLAGCASRSSRWRL